jgi:hypothetical protein
VAIAVELDAVELVGGDAERERRDADGEPVDAHGQAGRRGEHA